MLYYCKYHNEGKANQSCVAATSSKTRAANEIAELTSRAGIWFASDHLNKRCLTQKRKFYPLKKTVEKRILVLARYSFFV